MVGTIADCSNTRSQFKAKAGPIDRKQGRRMAAPAFIASTNSLEPL
jgi:hypothetical protein